jgi:nucleotide-binding universal stress UspA family protein
MKEKLHDAYAPSDPIETEYRIEEGHASETILRAAQEIGCDLIVMGTHGVTGLKRLLGGSVALAVLRGAQCPVVAVRVGVHPRDGQQTHVILHPTDFSASAEAALQVARSIARISGARLILLHVAPFTVAVEGGLTAEFDVSYAPDALEMVRERTEGPDLKYPVETWFSRGEAPDEIVRVADEIGCDLIVLGTHGRTGLGRLLMGNTAESVLPEASCPVIIVKSPTNVPAESSHSSGAKKAVTVF